MGRTYLIIIVVAGVLSSMLGGGGSSSGSSPVSASEGYEDGASRIAKYRDKDDEESSSSSSAVELTREANGHFYADVELNGVPTRMLVDTGATGIALSRSDARRAGLAVSAGMFEVVGEGADGAVQGEYVVLDRVSLGSESASKVPAVVLNSGAISLLGQSFLSEFDSVEIQGDRMVLK